jgi:hypothetical protein
VNITSQPLAKWMWMKITTTMKMTDVLPRQDQLASGRVRAASGRMA